jgi:hypothetical protein
MTKKMTMLIKLEELGQFLLSIVLFCQLDYQWWIFPALILLPDLSMIDIWPTQMLVLGFIISSIISY